MSLTPFHVCCPITHLAICRCENFSRPPTKSSSSSVAGVNRDLAQFAKHVKKTFQLYTHARPEYLQELRSLAAATATTTNKAHDEEADTGDSEENEETSNIPTSTIRVTQSHRFIVPAKLVKQFQQQAQQQLSSSTVSSAHGQAQALGTPYQTAATVGHGQQLPAPTTSVPTPVMTPALINALQQYISHTGLTPTSDPQQLALLYQQLRFQYEQQQQHRGGGANMQRATSTAATPSHGSQRLSSSANNLTTTTATGATISSTPRNKKANVVDSEATTTTTTPQSSSTTTSAPPTTQKKRGRPRKKRSCAECDKGDSTAQPPDPELLQCVNCGHCVHTFCHEPKLDHLSLAHRVIWRCEDCKVCELCGESGDEVKLLICESCDRGFHTYCLNPPLQDIPQNSWNCSQCLMAKRSLMQQESYVQQMAAQQAARQKMALAAANLISTTSTTADKPPPAKKQRQE